TQQTAIVCRPEENAPETDFACDSVPTLTGNSDDATGRALREFFDAFDGRVLITGASAGRRETLRDWLTTLGLAPARCANWAEFLQYDKAISVTSARLEVGTIAADAGIAIITESQLTGARPPARKRKRVVRDPETMLRE